MGASPSLNISQISQLEQNTHCILTLCKRARAYRQTEKLQGAGGRTSYSVHLGFQLIPISAKFLAQNSRINSNPGPTQLPRKISGAYMGDSSDWIKSTKVM